VGSSEDSLVPNSFFLQDGCGPTVLWSVDGLEEGVVTYGVVPEGALEDEPAKPLVEGELYELYFGATRPKRWSSGWGASFVHGQPETFTTDIMDCEEPASPSGG
jgi:hypothetical protein